MARKFGYLHPNAIADAKEQKLDLRTKQGKEFARKHARWLDEENAYAFHDKLMRKGFMFVGDNNGKQEMPQDKRRGFYNKAGQFLGTEPTYTSGNRAKRL